MQSFRKNSSVNIWYRCWKKCDCVNCSEAHYTYFPFTVWTVCLQMLTRFLLKCCKMGLSRHVWSVLTTRVHFNLPQTHGPPPMKNSLHRNSFMNNMENIWLKNERVIHFHTLLITSSSIFVSFFYLTLFVSYFNHLLLYTFSLLFVLLPTSVLILFYSCLPSPSLLIFPFLRQCRGSELKVWKSNSVVLWLGIANELELLVFLQPERHGVFVIQRRNRQSMQRLFQAGGGISDMFIRDKHGRLSFIELTIVVWNVIEKEAVVEVEKLWDERGSLRLSVQFKNWSRGMAITIYSYFNYS
jgi:hypothetical protein